MLNRREFLILTGAAGAGALLAACGAPQTPNAPPTPEATRAAYEEGLIKKFTQDKDLVLMAGTLAEIPDYRPDYRDGSIRVVDNIDIILDPAKRIIYSPDNTVQEYKIEGRTVAETVQATLANTTDSWLEMIPNAQSPYRLLYNGNGVWAKTLRTDITSIPEDQRQFIVPIDPAKSLEDGAKIGDYLLRRNGLSTLADQVGFGSISINGSKPVAVQIMPHFGRSLARLLQMSSPIINNSPKRVTVGKDITSQIGEADMAGLQEKVIADAVSASIDIGLLPYDLHNGNISLVPAVDIATGKIILIPIAFDSTNYIPTNIGEAPDLNLVTMLSEQAVDNINSFFKSKKTAQYFLDRFQRGVGPWKSLTEANRYNEMVSNWQHSQPNIKNPAVQRTTDNTVRLMYVPPPGMGSESVVIGPPKGLIGVTTESVEPINLVAAGNQIIELNPTVIKVTYADPVADSIVSAIRSGINPSSMLRMITDGGGSAFNIISFAFSADRIRKAASDSSVRVTMMQDVKGQKGSVSYQYLLNQYLRFLGDNDNIGNLLTQARDSLDAPTYDYLRKQIDASVSVANPWERQKNLANWIDKLTSGIEIMTNIDGILVDKRFANPLLCKVAYVSQDNFRLDFWEAVRDQENPDKYTHRGITTVFVAVNSNGGIESYTNSPIANNTGKVIVRAGEENFEVQFDKKLQGLTFTQVK